MLCGLGAYGTEGVCGPLWVAVPRSLRQAVCPAAARAGRQKGVRRLANMETAHLGVLRTFPSKT